MCVTEQTNVPTPEATSAFNVESVRGAASPIAKKEHQKPSPGSSVIIRHWNDLSLLSPFHGDGSATTVSFRVSPKHLSLASNVFRTMIQGPYKESIRNSCGLYEIQASEWDARCFFIMLNIIHGHNRDVPKLVTLEKLKQMAIIVNYYLCHEVVAFVVDIRIARLSTKLPTQFGDDSITWMFISQVFSNRRIWTSMATMAVQNSSGIIETDLPIPLSTLEHINLERRKIIDKLYNGLYDLVDRLLAGKEGCKAECSSMLLSSLLRQMHENGLRMDKLTNPWERMSIADVKRVMLDFHSPVWYSSNHTYTPHQCTVENKINDLLSGQKYLIAWHFFPLPSTWTEG
ncbi:hypothetical protein B0I35DRAFT_365877 [Stachybotrys elegans]|uniref:BTB domain-containing protein n=1 Tax=Stachybotrys elegans TaxID=80388 RepID=A0A8K0WII0_9HYPO|nr:hypothetical protein B0I35DRAFT_365877 [Stachybotrys elegans]